MDNWSKLSIKDRAELINLYLDGGVMSISQMRDHYNSFEDGGYKPSESIKRYIKSTEAFRSKWYKDGNGVPTVGYGFTGEYFKKKYPNGMTQEEADREFERVISNFASLVKRHTPNYDSLSQNQRDSLLSYMYNVGPGNYTTKSPKFQRALREKDWNAVAQNMDIGYNDQKNRGLRKRRDYERALFLGNSSQSQASPTQYYDDYKAQVAASPNVPMSGQAPPIGMPALYYNTSTHFKDQDFSTPLPVFDPNSQYNPMLGISSGKRKRRIAEANVPEIPSNEEIIGNLFERLNDENILAYGGIEEDEDFIGPVLKKSVVALNNDFNPKISNITSQRSSIDVAPAFGVMSEQSLKTAFEEQALRDAYKDKSYREVKEVSPVTVSSKVDTIEGNTYEDKKKEYYNLRGDAAKALQQELADNGYYSAILDGMSKDEVKSLQRKLINKGLLSNARNSDGTYKEEDGIVGNKTRAAFNTYSVDGIVGKNTKYAIELRDQQQNSSVASFSDSSKVIAQKDKCAAFVTQRFNEGTGGKARDLGVGGNAWNMLKNVENAGGAMIYNVFDDSYFDDVSTGNVVAKTKKAIAADPFNVSNLRPGDIIGIFNPGTSHYAEVLKNGDTYNSHVGICTGYKNGKPIIEHAINGRIIKQTADTVKIAAVARPANSSFSKMNIGNSEEQKYYVRGQEENQLLNEYSKGLNNSAKYMSQVFPDVNFDNIQQIALSVLKRETGYMTNTEKMQRERSKFKNLEYGAKDFYKYNIKGESAEQKSTDLGKFKLSSLTLGERQMLGIESPQDLENPTILSKAVTYYLSKNYSYFQNLAKKYPELGLTEEDIVNLTTISYNQGMDRLKSIGFKNGKIAPEEIRAIRDSANNDAVVDDIKSTTWARAGKIGEKIGKATGLYTKSTSYSSSARRERENNIYTLSDTTE